MAKVPNGAETLRKISIATDDDTFVKKRKVLNKTQWSLSSLLHNGVGGEMLRSTHVTCHSIRLVGLTHTVDYGLVAGKYKTYVGRRIQICYINYTPVGYNQTNFCKLAILCHMM